MPIRNRDGSLYSLSGPNPLARFQEKWDQDIVFHNLKWEAEVISPGKQSGFLGKIHDPVMFKEEEIFAEIEPELPEKVKSKEEPAKTSPKIKNIVLTHCLPSIIRERKDELYGETYTRVVYGDKKIIEGVVVNVSDFEIIFWASSSAAKGSIIFPSRYKDTGDPYMDQRWWKIKECTPHEGGYLLEGFVSDYQPDFSS
jgi:hypothetical protein